MSIWKDWGTTSAERLLDFPCDGFIDESYDCLYRGVTVNAPPTIIYRWLCQMRVAPYSYDWIDNFGRRSPRSLTPGMENLSVGTPILGLFEVVGFEPDRSVTLRGVRERMGAMGACDCLTSYMIAPSSGGSCRLLVKLAFRFEPTAVGALMRRLMPPADLIMMRKQLLNFRALAEKTAASG